MKIRTSYLNLLACLACLLAACASAQATTPPAPTQERTATPEPTIAAPTNLPSPTDTPTETIAPTAPAGTSHGGQFVVTTYERGTHATIYFMDVKQAQPVALTDEKSNNWSPVWSPDGMKIAFASDRDGQNELYSMNPDGSDQTRLTHTAVDKMGLRWSPDGKKIAFVDRFIPEGPPPVRASLYVVNADGTNMVKLADQIVNPHSVKWSPDSRRLAFIQPLEAKMDLMIVESDGTGLKSLGVQAMAGEVYCFSPDGRQLAYTRLNPDGKGHQLMLVDTEGGPSTLLAGPGIGGLRDPLAPRWTQQNQILFMDQADDTAPFYVSGRLFRIDPDGKNLVELAGDRTIRWFIGPSADGKQVALIVVLGQGADYYMEIQVMNVDGTEARLVTNMGMYFDFGRWSPDNQYFDVFGYLNNQAHSPDARDWVISLDGRTILDIRQFFDLMDPIWRP